MTLHVGDCLDILPTLPAASVQTCITSPPYWGLRDYGVGGQLGLEPTPDEYVATMVRVFAEVWRVLRDDGTLWLNLGDSYGTSGGFAPDAPSNLAGSKQAKTHPHATQKIQKDLKRSLRHKDLIGIPWRVAFALQSAGWYLRSDIIWAKPNPMPESVTDRPTKAHEYLFLLSKAQRYYYDAEAIAERALQPGGPPFLVCQHKQSALSANQTGTLGTNQGSETRNRRSVWTVATQPYAEAHFATFPRKLIEPCVLAGSRAGDTVLDPFMGSGTVAQVAQDLGREWIGCELNPDYARFIDDRTRQQALL